MSLRFCSFSSDSSGNCYLITDDETSVLIDVGISGKKVIEGINFLEMAPERIKGVLLTHEHVDHVKSVKVLSGKLENAQFYCTDGTYAAINDKLKKDKHITVSGGDIVHIGNIKVEAFNLSHDASEPVGYALSNDSGKIVIVTDTGCVTEEIFDQIRRADILVLEANHEVNILKMGDYPYEVKRRILSDVGHLSNETAGRCICRFLRERKSEKKQDEVPEIILAHMSQRNNTPLQAYLTIKNILDEQNFKENEHYYLSVAVKDKITPIFSL